MVTWVADPDRSLNIYPCYGGLQANTTGGAPMAVTPAAAPLNMWNGILPYPPSLPTNLTVNLPLNRLEILYDGIYDINAHVSWSGTINSAYTFDIYNLGVPSGSRATDAISAVAVPHVTALHSLMRLVAGDILTLEVSSATGIIITVTDAEFTAKRRATGLELAP